MGKRLKSKFSFVDIFDADLAFIDEGGNIAMQVSEGHVETANFDSRQVATNTSAIQQLQSQIGQQGSVQTDVVVKQDADAAFDIADENGKVALRITNKGHIKTMGFDSENMDVFRALKLDSPQCICHGYQASTGYANTIPYFRAGYAAGYRFFECDALRCTEGEPICTHNASTLTVYDKTTHEQLIVTVTDGIVQMSSDELVGSYTWDAAGNAPIATLKDVIWQICYFYRCPLHVDGQGLNAAARKAASQYADELGVAKYVFHEGSYTNNGAASWGIPANFIIPANANNIPSIVQQCKKADNNIIFSYEGSSSSASDAELAAFAKAAHDNGCYTEVWPYTDIDSIRRLFKCGIDFIITSGKTNNDV